MKILLDTNVLISAFVFGGKAGTLFAKLFDSDHELYISEYVDREFKSQMQKIQSVLSREHWGKRFSAGAKIIGESLERVTGSQKMKTI